MSLFVVQNLSNEKTLVYAYSINNKMVTGFFYVWLINYISFFVCLILYFRNQKNREQEPKEKRNAVSFLIPFGIMAAYQLFRVFTGWKIVGWYPEAIIVLGLFVYFDIEVLANDRYNRKIVSLFLWIRSIYISGTVVRLILSILLVVVAWNPKNYMLPMDRANDVHVYKNIYVYDNTRNYVLKCKNEFFEKDILRIHCPGFDINGGSLTDYSPVGEITVNGNEIFLSQGHGAGKEMGILVTILSNRKLRVQVRSGMFYDRYNNKSQGICLDTLIHY